MTREGDAVPWAEWSDALRARPWWIAAVVGLGVLVAALLLVLRSPATADAATGMLRLAHLSPRTPAVDVYVAARTSRRRSSPPASATGRRRPT